LVTGWGCTTGGFLFFTLQEGFRAGLKGGKRPKVFCGTDRILVGFKRRSWDFFTTGVFKGKGSVLTLITFFRGVLSLSLFSLFAGGDP